MSVLYVSDELKNLIAMPKQEIPVHSFAGRVRCQCASVVVDGGAASDGDVLEIGLLPKGARIIAIAVGTSVALTNINLTANLNSVAIASWTAPAANTFTWAAPAANVFLGGSAVEGFLFPTTQERKLTVITSGAGTLPAAATTARITFFTLYMID